MIIDSHCHAWARWPYQPPVPDPEQRACVEQLLFEMDQAGVDQAMLVAARIDHNLDNNDYVAEAVRRHPKRLHQLADIDCKWSAEYHTPGAAARLAAAAERFDLKGFTHYVEPANDGWFRSADGRELFAAAAERRLIASLAAAPAWQGDIRALAKSFPAVPILCHHLAGIRPGSAAASQALEEVLESAACPNILIKISGFYYGSDEPWDFPYEAVQPLVRRLYDAFGGERLVWGSDYPVSRPHITYRQSLEAVRSHCRFIPPSHLDRVLGSNLAGLLTDAGSGR